jgi:hypothetical protein
MGKLRVQSEETKLKISLSRIGDKNPMYGKFGKDNPKYKMIASEETRNKMSLASKNQEIVTCPHCGKSGKLSVMHRYHFGNCKYDR